MTRCSSPAVTAVVSGALIAFARNTSRLNRCRARSRAAITPPLDVTLPARAHGLLVTIRFRECRPWVGGPLVCLASDTVSGGEDGGGMLSIGEFARLGAVSVRIAAPLRRPRLFRPARVDEWTGHRRYEVSQLRELNRIVTLKELDFTLAQVGELPRDGVADDELRR